MSQPEAVEALANRFGGGRVARQAAARVLRQRKQQPNYDEMFAHDTASLGSATSHSRDALDDEAYTHSTPYPTSGRSQSAHAPVRRSGATRSPSSPKHDQRMDHAAGTQHLQPRHAGAAPRTGSGDSYPYRQAASSGPHQRPEHAEHTPTNPIHDSSTPPFQERMHPGPPHQDLQASGHHGSAADAPAAAALAFHGELPAQRPQSPTSQHSTTMNRSWDGDARQSISRPTSANRPSPYVPDEREQYRSTGAASLDSSPRSDGPESPRQHASGRPLANPALPHRQQPAAPSPAHATAPKAPVHSTVGAVRRERTAEQPQGGARSPVGSAHAKSPTHLATVGAAPRPIKTQAAPSPTATPSTLDSAPAATPPSPAHGPGTPSAPRGSVPRSRPAHTAGGQAMAPRALPQHQPSPTTRPGSAPVGASSAPYLPPATSPAARTHAMSATRPGSATTPARAAASKQPAKRASPSPLAPQLRQAAPAAHSSVTSSTQQPTAPPPLQPQGPAQAVAAPQPAATATAASAAGSTPLPSPGACASASSQVQANQQHTEVTGGSVTSSIDGSLAEAALLAEVLNMPASPRPPPPQQDSSSSQRSVPSSTAAAEMPAPASSQGDRQTAPQPPQQTGQPAHTVGRPPQNTGPPAQSVEQAPQKVVAPSHNAAPHFDEPSQEMGPRSHSHVDYSGNIEHGDASEPGLPTLPRCQSPGPSGAGSRLPGSRQRPSSAGAAGGRGFVASSQDRKRDPHAYSEQFFGRFRVKKHRDPSLPQYEGHRPTPDYKFSQPASDGPQLTLQQVVWNFDDAHPAIAGVHCMRTKDQDALLADERTRRRRAALRDAAAHTKRRQQGAIMRRSAAERSNRPSSAAGSRYEARLEELSELGQMYRSEGHSVQQRAKQALAASAVLSARHRVSSRSPSTTARSPSPLRPPSAGAFPLPRMHIGKADDRYVNELEQRVDKLQRMLEAVARGEEVDALGDEVADVVELLQEAGSEDDVHGQDVNASLADHLAAMGRSGPMEEDEMVKASGAFHPERYTQYERHLGEKMARRAQIGRERGSVAEGYDSDIEEELAARREEEEEAALADLEAAGRQKHANQAAQWEEDNSWMDQYRYPEGGRGGSLHSGYTSPHSEAGSDDPRRAGRAGVASSSGPSRPRDADESERDEGQLGSRPGSPYGGQWADHGAYHPGSVLTMEDEILMQHPYVPSVSPEMEHLVGASDDERGRRSVSRVQSPGYHSDQGYSAAGARRRQRRRFQSTVPQPFTFEERARERPKPIAQVKLEQDLEIRRREAAAAKQHCFRAKPTPSSTLEPRYQQIQAEQEYKRMLSHERNAETLRSLEQPFSFYERDIDKHRARVGDTRRDPNRFQIRFKAKPIPAHVKEDRFMLMMAEAEMQKSAARARLDAARAKSLLLRSQHAQQRRQEAQDAYSARLHETRVRTVDPVWNQKYNTKPLGAVPDFDSLHTEWERRQATVKANNRRRVTVPQGFSLHGGTQEEAARRARKDEERRKRLLLEIALDEENLHELRWPYKSRRAKVRPTPPPAFEQPDISHADTKANRLRIAATRQAISHGQYASKEVKEQQALERAKRAAAERARAWTKMQQRMAAGKLGTSMGNLEAFGGPGAGAGELDHNGGEARGDKKESTLERRDKLKGRADTPVQHIEARHKQAEALAKQEVEAVLLAQGLDVYKYVEG